MKFVYNLNRLSGDGYKMNANNPLVAEPTNITHAQLRYDDYLSPNIIQGEIVGQYGTNSSVLFTVTEARNDYKLYTSTNGTSYTEDKTFGGNSGVSIGSSLETTFTSITNEGALYETGFISTDTNIDFTNTIRIVELQSAVETPEIMLPNPEDSEGRVLDFYCLNSSGGYPITAPIQGSIYEFTNGTTYIILKCYNGKWRIASLNTEAF